MKIGIYCECVTAFDDTQDFLYNACLKLCEQNDITYIFSDNNFNIDVFKRFSAVCHIINYKYFQDEEFDIVIYANEPKDIIINSVYKNIQIVSNLNIKNRISVIDEHIKLNDFKSLSSALTIEQNKENKIAIIVPNYNYGDCLEKCLTSILNQTYTNYEIIFVDDMSVDNSVDIAKKLLKPPHKVIELKQKRLNGGARNEAYLHMSDDVDYVWYVDSDDWLIDKNVLQTINDNLYRNPDVLFVGIAQYKDGKQTTCRTPDYKDRYDAFEGWSGSCGKVIKKSLAVRQECLYNEGTLKEDKNQHRRICIYMNRFSLLKEPVYVWNRSNAKSVTTIRNAEVWGTSTIRHWADTLQLYLSVKGKDPKMDALLKKKVELTKKEALFGGDKQY